MLKIQIVNPEGKKDETTKKVVSIIETLGANVLAIDKSDSKWSSGKDCTIFTGSENVAYQKLADVFSCLISTEKDTNFDAVIELGENFYRRF